MEEEKSITFSCRVVILYFRCDLGRILEEICYSGFLSFSKSANRSICGTYILLTGVFAGAFAERWDDCDWDTHGGSSIDAFADGIHGWGWGTRVRSFVDTFAGGEHGCDWDMHGRSSIGTSTNSEHGCN